MKMKKRAAPSSGPPAGSMIGERSQLVHLAHEGEDDWVHLLASRRIEELQDEAKRRVEA